MAAGARVELSDAIRAALTETGALGATIRQLASRLDDRPRRVETALAELHDQGRVLRMGRGLWMLRDYERLPGRPDFVDPEEFVDRFERESGVRLGRYAGPITFRSNEALPVHRWWPYVQGFSADFVRGVLDTHAVDRGTVLDPFAGSGTTLVEARRAGRRAWGTELLAPAVLAARVKTDFELDPEGLARASDRMLGRAAGRTADGPLPFLRETRRQFSPRALTELRRLRDALPVGERPVDRALRLAFGRVLIPASRLHRSPCLGYGRRTDAGGPSATDRFRAAVAQMADDLRTLGPSRPEWGPRARVETRDARDGRWPAGSVDLAITSPPYVNGMDYVMNYKVDLAWLGYVRSYRELAQLRAAEVACDNLPRAETAPYLDPAIAPDPWLPEILERIRDNVRRKGTYRRDDMHGIVHRYFADLVPVLRGVRAALVPGGRFVLVVGDSLIAGAYIPGDLLLARVATHHGFSIESVEVARARRSGQRRSFALRETVVTLRRT